MKIINTKILRWNVKKNKINLILVLIVTILFLFILFFKNIVRHYEIESFKKGIEQGTFYEKKSTIPDMYFNYLSPFWIEEYIRQSSDLSLLLRIIISHDKRYIGVLNRLNSYSSKQISRYCPKGIIWLKRNIGVPHPKETEPEEVKRFIHFFNTNKLK